MPRKSWASMGPSMATAPSHTSSSSAWEESVITLYIILIRTYPGEFTDLRDSVNKDCITKRSQAFENHQERLEELSVLYMQYIIKYMDLGEESSSSYSPEI